MSRLTSINPKEFKVGDIICDKISQSNELIILFIDDVAIWVIPLLLCSLTIDNTIHPAYPIYFKEIDNGSMGPYLRIGNIDDYKQFIDDIQPEIQRSINSINGYYKNISKHR